MKHFRTNHLPAEHLAIVPERGYDNAQNQSMLALKFLSWLEQESGVQIQSAHSAGGEKRIGPYSLDGWIEDERRAIEVHGIFFFFFWTLVQQELLQINPRLYLAWLQEMLP